MSINFFNKVSVIGVEPYLNVGCSALDVRCFVPTPKFSFPLPKMLRTSTVADMNPNDFLCPECGSREPGASVFVSTVYNEDDPWSSIMQRIECNQCHSTIPAHLAERWDNLTIEDAQKEWQEIYRDTQPTPRARRRNE